MITHLRYSYYLRYKILQLVGVTSVNKHVFQIKS